MARLCGRSIFKFSETLILFSVMTAPIYNPTNSAQKFQIFHIQHLSFSGVLFGLVSGHPNSCEVILHVFIYILLMISDIEHLVICLVAICIFSLEKYLFKSFVHFKSVFLLLLLLLSCGSSLYILENNPLFHMWYVNISSNYIGCLLL